MTKIHETVWTNQINLTPKYMKIMGKSGEFVSWRKNNFVTLKEDEDVLNQELQDRLWDVSLELWGDEIQQPISISEE